MQKDYAQRIQHQHYHHRKSLQHKRNNSGGFLLLIILIIIIFIVGLVFLQYHHHKVLSQTSAHKPKLEQLIKKKSSQPKTNVASKKDSVVKEPEPEYDFYTILPKIKVKPDKKE